ncbi:MAG TPA: response regulator transcription factor [Chloroflexaceae bacterium]|nr:response regulator transcription factor [Chloroflexaceae bacterium]
MASDGAANSPALTGSPQESQELFGLTRRLYEQGRLRVADRLLANALGATVPRESPPVTAMLGMVWGSVLLAQNRLTEAIGAADQALALAAQLNNRHVDPMALAVKLHALWGLGRADEAAALSAEITLRRRDSRIVPWLQATALAEQLRYGLISGDRPGAAAWAAELEALAAALAEVPEFLGLTVELAQIRAAWELRQADVRPRLQAVLGAAAAHGLAGLQVEALLLRARLAAADGDTPATLAALDQALALAAPEGAIHAVLDAGPEVPPLVALFEQTSERVELRPFIAQVQMALDAPVTPTAPPRSAAASTAAPETAGAKLIEPLSEREAEVLRLLAEGHTNRELAARLVVAEGTIKTHLMNIYGKLGARNRTEAIARARTLGLL